MKPLGFRGDKAGLIHRGLHQLLGHSFRRRSEIPKIACTMRVNTARARMRPRPQTGSQTLDRAGNVFVKQEPYTGNQCQYAKAGQNPRKDKSRCHIVRCGATSTDKKRADDQQHSGHGQEGKEQEYPKTQRQFCQNLH